MLVKVVVTVHVVFIVLFVLFLVIVKLTCIFTHKILILHGVSSPLNSKACYRAGFYYFSCTSWRRSLDSCEILLWLCLQHTLTVFSSDSCEIFLWQTIHARAFTIAKSHVFSSSLKITQLISSPILSSHNQNLPSTCSKNVHGVVGFANFDFETLPFGIYGQYFHKKKVWNRSGAVLVFKKGDFVGPNTSKEGTPLIIVMLFYVPFVCMEAKCLDNKYKKISNQKRKTDQ